MGIDANHVQCFAQRVQRVAHQKGLRIVGLAGLRTNNLLPADFLIEEDGRIAECHYGSDAGDRIPFERVELFLARGLMQRAAA